MTLLTSVLPDGQHGVQRVSLSNMGLLAARFQTHVGFTFLLLGFSFAFVHPFICLCPSSPWLNDRFATNLHSGSLDKKTHDGNTALHLCAQLNKTECMKLMLRTRPDLANIENKAGKTPLELARDAGNQLCAELVSAWLGC